MRLFSVTSANVAISDISLKTRLFGLHFRRRLYGSIFDHFDVIYRKATKIGEKTQDNGHYVVQGHSTSLIWYQWKALVPLPMYTVSGKKRPKCLLSYLLQNSRNCDEIRHVVS